MTIDFWYLTEIYEALNSPGTAHPDLLREAAIAYADACRDANARLHEVSRLLRKGLRSEAIQLSDREPALLEQVDELDFALRDEWLGMLAQWGMQLPPPLDREAAQWLNTTYSELLPLEQLLRQQRLLALGRAPLASRIGILRRIVRKDPSNPAWLADLEAYERVRLSQIKNEVNEFGRKSDLDRLIEIRHELADEKWSCPIPSDLVNDLNTQANRAVVTHARRELEELLPQLDGAYSELDVPRAVSLSRDWRERAMQAGLTDGDPLCVKAAAALDWTAEQQKLIDESRAFDDCIASLQTALDDSCPLGELESLIQRVERFDRPISDQLRQRMNQRKELLQGQARRRGVLLRVAATVIVVLVCAVGTILWRANQKELLVRRHAEYLEERIRNEQWDQGRTYLDKLSEELKDVPELKALDANMEEGRRKEDARAREFKDLLEEAEKRSNEDPDYPLPDRLEDVAKTPEEKRRLEKLKLSCRERRLERQKERDDAFQPLLKKWVDRIAKLEKVQGHTYLTLRAELQQLQADLGKHSQVSSGLRQEANALVTRLRAILERESDNANEMIAWNSVYKAVGRPDDFVATMENLKTQFPDTTLAKDAARFLDEQMALRTLVAWSDFWDQSDGSWTDLAPSAASRILKRGDELLQQPVTCELGQEFAERRDFLTAVASRGKADIADLKAFLCQNPLSFDVWLVVDKEGVRYYCPERPRSDGENGIRFRPFDDAATPPHVTEMTLAKLKLQYNGLSPQAVMVPIFTKELNGLPTAWDRTFFGMAQLIIEKANENDEDNPQLEPVLALDMLRRVLSTGAEGSWLFRRAFSSVIADIENSGADLSVAWFLPDDDIANNARRDARAVLAGLNDLAKLAKETREKYGRRASPPSSPLQWIGAVDKSEKGDWTCTPEMEDATGRLFVAFMPDMKSVSLRHVGQLQKGHVTWLLEAAGKLYRGQPLFLRK